MKSREVPSGLLTQVREEILRLDMSCGRTMLGFRLHLLQLGMEMK